MSSPKWLWWWHQEWNQEKWLKEEVNFYFVDDTRKQNKKRWMQSEIWKDSRWRPGIPTKGGGGWTGFLETFPVKGKSTRKKGPKWPLFLKPGMRPGRQTTSWNDPPGNGQKRQVTAKFQADWFVVHCDFTIRIWSFPLPGAHQPPWCANRFRRIPSHWREKEVAHVS